MHWLPLLALLVVSAAFAAQQDPAPEPRAPAIAAKSWLLVDFSSGQRLASHDPQRRIEPASLTKLMTAYVVFAALKEKRIRPGQVVPVSEQAWRAEGSRMFIEPRKAVTVDELVRGMIVQSGNDACIALADLVAGSEDAFVALMNRQAERLGLKNTRYVNVTGLPNPQHYSTAEDIALLAAAIIRDFPEHYPLYSQREYRYNNITQVNRNRLLWTDPTVDGMKSGYTQNAGYCLVTSARRAASGGSYRWCWARAARQAVPSRARSSSTTASSPTMACASSPASTRSRRWRCTRGRRTRYARASSPTCISPCPAACATTSRQAS